MNYTIDFKKDYKASAICTQTAIVVEKENRVYCFHFKFVHDGEEPAMIEGRASDGQHIVLYKQHRSYEELIDCYFEHREIPNAGDIPTKWSFIGSL